MIPRQVARSLKSFARVAPVAAPRLAAGLPALPRQSRWFAAPCLRRHYATPPPQVVQSDLPAELYHEYSEVTMDKMTERLEELLDDLGNPAYEVEYSSGVLTLKLGEQGTYVINKQPPNKQIWLSSPWSGPKRYDYTAEKDEWVYARDGRSLGDLLNEELSKALGREVDLELRDVSKDAAAAETAKPQQHLLADALTLGLTNGGP